MEEERGDDGSGCWERSFSRELGMEGFERLWSFLKGAQK